MNIHDYTKKNQAFFMIHYSNKAHHYRFKCYEIYYYDGVQLLANTTHRYAVNVFSSILLNRCQMSLLNFIVDFKA